MTTGGFLYMLKSHSDSSFYFGSTSDINRRLAQHNNGESSSTRTKRPWVLVFVMKFDQVAQARKIEQTLKAQKQKITPPRLLLAIADYLRRAEE
ncbi:GIY-YIG nuclease family protein [Candidatus Peribacteria bacterium]|nr:GIY-YIG nuclease family protein [Candidatus Peribacteria bacterium]